MKNNPLLCANCGKRMCDSVPLLMRDSIPLCSKPCRENLIKAFGIVLWSIKSFDLLMGINAKLELSRRKRVYGKE